MIKETIYKNILATLGRDFSDEEMIAIAEQNFDIYCEERKNIWNIFADPFNKEQIETLFSQMEGRDFLDSALSRNRGVIILSAHFLHGELGMMWLSYKGYRVNLVYDYGEGVPEISIMEQAFENMGIKMIRSGRSFVIRTNNRNLVMRTKTMENIVSCLRNNEIVVMLPDLQLPSSQIRGGVDVNFLGHASRISYAPIAIARRTGAIILTGAVIPAGEGSFEGCLFPPLASVHHINAKELYSLDMQKYIDIFEEYIRLYPQEYLWCQPNRWFKNDEENAR